MNNVRKVKPYLWNKMAKPKRAVTNTDNTRDGSQLKLFALREHECQIFYEENLQRMLSKVYKYTSIKLIWVGKRH